jgi:hypothetical protein
LIWIKARAAIYAAPYLLLRPVTVVHISCSRIGAGPLAAKERAVESTKDEQVSKGSEADVRIQVPNRPSTSLFQGKQGGQKGRFISIPTLTS